MTRLFFLILLLFLASCSTTQLVESWKNPDIDVYLPAKVLVVGLTSNINAQEKFEKQLKAEFELRGAETVMSLTHFDSSVKAKKMTEETIKALEDNLIKEGFDTILFSKIIGVEDKITYKQNYGGYDQTYKKFKEDYLFYQDIYYNPDYYDEYPVYHAETSMYCICPTKERELLWKGYIDIIDPQSVDNTVTDYIKLVLLVLEDQQLIPPKISEENKTKSAIPTN